MFVILPVVISMTLGILCGAWISVVPFSIVAFVGSIGSATAIWLADYGIGYAFINFFIVAASLQFGYVIGILGVFVVNRYSQKERPPLAHYKPKHDTNIS